MERRLFLAILFSLLVWLVWSAFTAKLNWEKTPISSPVVPKKPVSEPELSAASFLNLDLEKFSLVWVEPWAAIKEVVFKDYQSYKLPFKYGLSLADKTLVFQKQALSNEEAVFICQDNNKKIIKHFIFSKSSYFIELEIELQNLSPSSINTNLELVLGALNFSQNRTQMRFQDITVGLPERALHIAGNKPANFERIKFLGLRDRYFCAIIEPTAENYSAEIKKINSHEFMIQLASQKTLLAPGQKLEQKFRIYLGPQDLKTINQINPTWTAVVHYGAFDFISQFLLQLLAVFYTLMHNWGWAIVSLSLFIYLLLFPLTLKQMRSTKEMHALQPRIEELRKMYKDNPQRLNKEVLALYREHKVNPFSGCIPIILQIPIFFALYQALTRSIALKGASFFWIKDLSEPDRLWIMPVSLPVIGNELNILPILMSIIMFFQQKLSLVGASSNTAEQQRLMTILFPFVFGVLFYHVPAGLVLYWSINSVLMLSYQLRIMQRK